MRITLLILLICSFTSTIYSQTFYKKGEKKKYYSINPSNHLFLGTQDKKVPKTDTLKMEDIQTNQQVISMDTIQIIEHSDTLKSSDTSIVNSVIKYEGSVNNDYYTDDIYTGEDYLEEQSEIIIDNETVIVEEIKVISKPQNEVLEVHYLKSNSISSFKRKTRKTKSSFKIEGRPKKAVNFECYKFKKR